MADPPGPPPADLRRANAELVASRRAALNALEDAVQARDTLRDREAWLRGQRAALEAALNGAPLAASLGRLVRTAATALGEGARAAFYLTAADGQTLRHVVGMPAAYSELVDGSKFAPESVACRRAADLGEPILTADVTTDPWWEDWRWLAARFDYRGCWSFPITTAAGTPVGTLAFYWPHPRQPTARELELADLLTHTAAVIISRHQETAAREWAEGALRASEDRLRLALDAARMGTWTWDPAADAHVRDANLNLLLGLDAAETTRPLADFLARVHPDDRAGLAAGIEATRAGQPLAAEFRVVWPDGTVRWLRDQGSRVAGDGGALTGAVVDVTDRRAAEERLRLVLASATDYAIFTTDPDRTVTSWSPGAEAVLGWAAEEMVGRSADVLFTPEDRAAGAPAQEAETARREGRAADERWHLRKDGSRFFASGVFTPLGDPGRGFVKVMRDLTDRKRTEDELRATREHLERRVAGRTAELTAALDALEAEMARRRDLARRLATAQEDERRRVSRELHDSVGQLLAGLSLATKAALATTDLPPAVETRLTDVLRLADAVGKELHGLAVRLRPTALDDLGLAAALEQLVREWGRRARVPADYQATGLGAVRLPPDVETALYRVVQEALTNVARHARAAAVAITVGVGEGAATVVVEDDGEGFDPDTAGKGRLGLVGMRERLALVGGALEVESSPGQGTTIIARVPLGDGARPRG